MSFEGNYYEACKRIGELEDSIAKRDSMPLARRAVRLEAGFRALEEDKRKLVHALGYIMTNPAEAVRVAREVLSMVSPQSDRSGGE